jgi:hypothetical protein
LSIAGFIDVFIGGFIGVIKYIVGGNAAAVCRAQEHRIKVRTKSGTLKGGR